MKQDHSIVYAAAAGAAVWALYRLWKATQPAAPAAAVPPVVAPNPALVDIVAGQSWGAAGASLADRIAIPGSLWQP